MQTLPESTSCQLSRNLVTAIALVSFGVLALTTLHQRREVDQLENRVAVLEQQSLRLTTSVQALESAARDDQAAEVDQDDQEGTMDEDAASDSKDRLTAAQALYVQGEYELAVQVVEPATRVEATAERAWRIIAASSCFEHDAKNAKRASAKLDDEGQQFVAYVCSRNGVKL